MTSVSTDRRQGVNAGMAIKVPCLAASTANLTLEGEQTVDTLPLLTGDRVLVKDQTDGSENGIYVVDSGEWSRSIDFDGSFDATLGSIVYVCGGSTNANKVFRLATSDPVIGTTSLSFQVGLFSDLSTSTFLQAGTGAVVRAAQDKMRDEVSVMDFGATGDGVADDTAECQAAIDTGKRITFPEGKTFLTAGLTLATAKQEIVLRGTVKLKNATNLPVFSVGANRVKFRFHGGEIDGNKANQTTVVDGLGEGIWIQDGFDNIEIWDPYIHDTRRSGIAGAGNSTDCVVIGGSVEDANFMGIFPSITSAKPTFRWLISGVYITGFQQDAIGTVGIRNATISGNRMVIGNSGTPVSCISLEAGCHYTSVFGNTCEGSASVANPNGCGIQVNDSHHVTVTGNTCKGLSVGIQVPQSTAPTSDVTITGNSIFDCGYGVGAAIFLNNATGNYDLRALVANNTISDCPYAAITLSGVSHCILNANQIWGVNLQNSASKRLVSGITMFNKAYYNTVTNNVINEGTAGFMKIGIHEHSTAGGFDAGVSTIRDNRIIGADFDIICGSTAYALSGHSKVTRVFDTAVTAVPTTQHWEKGQRLDNEQPGQGDAAQWIATASGTFSANAGTGAINTGTTQLTFANAADAAKFFAGQRIKVVGAGAAAADLDTFIAAFDGTSLTCTLKDAAGTTVAANAVTNIPPTFSTLTLS